MLKAHLPKGTFTKLVEKFVVCDLGATDKAVLGSLVLYGKRSRRWRAIAGTVGGHDCGRLVLIFWFCSFSVVLEGAGTVWCWWWLEFNGLPR